MCGCSSEQEAIEFLHLAPSERLDWLVALSERLAPSDTCCKSRGWSGYRLVDEQWTSTTHSSEVEPTNTQV